MDPRERRNIEKRRELDANAAAMRAANGRKPAPRELRRAAVSVALLPIRDRSLCEDHGPMVAAVASECGVSPAKVYNVAACRARSHESLPVQRAIDAYYAGLQADHGMDSEYPIFADSLYRICHQINGHRVRVEPPIVNDLEFTDGPPMAREYQWT